MLNIPGNDVGKGEERKAYVGSGPPKDTGLHRYVFVLYKHDQPIQAADEPHIPGNMYVRRVSPRTRPTPRTQHRLRGSARTESNAVVRVRCAPSSAAKRNNWKVNHFAEANHLGSPVGVNFFQAEWDDYVPTLYAGFKG